MEATFILLFVIATAVAIGARRLRLPYTVALVLAGLVLGQLQLFPSPHLTKNLLFAVFLPGLIFEAAFHIDARELRNNLLTILLLAVPGVVASIALVTVTLTPLIGALGLAAGFTWQYVLVFGALISATDPVAVVALFRNMGAPRRLVTLLDGESLLNDGTAIVFFTLSLSLLAGEAPGPVPLTVQFLSIVGIGATIGTLVGLAASQLMRRIDDPMVEITLTTIAAYGSFVTAEAVHASGVIAAVAAGVICGQVGARSGMSPSTRVATETFWEYLTFAFNSIVFLLVGLEVHLGALVSYWVPILVAYVIVTVGRGLVIVAARALLGLTRQPFPWRWTLVLTWGGLRGALPMVLVLSLPVTFAHRDLLISMTFGVAVLSILIHGLTMPALLERLHLVYESAEHAALDLRRGRLRAAAAALAELDRAVDMHLAPAEMIEEFRDEYRHSMESDEKALRDLAGADRPSAEHERRHLRRRLLVAERDEVMRAFRQGALDRASMRQLLADIDARLLNLEGD